MTTFTDEQLLAIERRRGDLLLSAGAGSGKTAVMVERFVRSVVEDELRVDQILAITFTEKAAAELAMRLREALRARGREEDARALDSAWVSTIHGFCARLLRTHPLQAGIDPRFGVLEETAADRLEDLAFTSALDAWIEERGEPAVRVAADFGTFRLRGAIVDVHGELRSRGLPAELPPAPPAPDLGAAAAALRTAAAELGAELRAIDEPSKRVLDALAALDACASLPELPDEVRPLALPGGNGKALGTEAAERYREACAAYTQACVDQAARPAWELLDALLRAHAARYAELKRSRSALDFADLELVARDLLRERADLRASYAERFAAIMVDEFQDTNPLQLELLDLIARENLFTVGDELQSIYGFRHADVEGFRGRRATLARRDATATLSANFRSRRAILDTIDLAFAERFGAAFVPLRPAREDAEDAPGAPPRVELLLTDRDAEWSNEPLVAGDAAPAGQLWRLAEARLLARRIRELVDEGFDPGEIVVLLRATGDLSVFERAIEDEGVRTYVVGGRGYWAQREVQDLIAHLSVLANPRDEQRLYEVLASPLGGISSDGLVLIGAAARAAKRTPWRVLREAFDAGEDEGQLSFDFGGDPAGAPLAALDREDRERLAALVPWLAEERAAAPRLPVAALLDRVLDRTRYDETMLRWPAGARRLANVRKLMRLAREHEATDGRDLRSFLDLVADRGGDGTREGREAEAPVEGEGLEAVRLMTIHRAKGLEFDVVCVADLGRGAPPSSEVIRLGSSGEVGLRLATRGGLHDAFAYRSLGDARRARDAEEERRLLYVALTRARERLVVSGSVRLDPWPDPSRGESIRWLGPALVPDVAELAAGGAAAGVFARSVGDWRSEVAWTVNRPGAGVLSALATAAREPPPPSPPPLPFAPATPGVLPRFPYGEPGQDALSFTALEAHARCGYRYYVEEVLGLPPAPERGAGEADGDALPGTARGVLVHALLEDLDFAAPARPGDEAVSAAARELGIALEAEQAADVAGLVEAFARSPLLPRLAAAERVAREERFAYLLDVPTRPLIVGVLDVLAWEGTRALVVDYKTNRLLGRAPAAVVEDEYALQRLVYALALLRAGAEEVEVAYCFLERPEDTVAARYPRSRLAELEEEVVARASGLLGGEFVPSAHPHRELCLGCPARAGLCVHPPALTGRPG